MSDKKISQLPAVSTPLAGTEVLPIVQSGVTKKVSVDEINAGLAVYPAAGIPVSTGTAWGSSLPVPLTPANGGTGATTLPANNVLLGNGTSAVLAVAPGTVGNVLTSNGTTWSSSAPIGSGDVTGPASSTDNAVTRFNGTTGKAIQNSSVIIDDSNNVSGVATLNAANIVIADNATLGSSNTDSVAVNGRITTDLEPNTTGSHDIGTSGRNWRDGFFSRNLTTANLSVTGTTSFDGSQGTSGQVLTSTGTGNTPTWSTPAVGTVTSVGGTGTVNGISLSGTVTSSGNLTLGGALTGVNLGTQVTGTLPVANGGTGQTSYTDGQLLIGNSTGNTLAKAILTAGSGINITNGAGSITIESTAGGGSVTSVAATVPSFLSVTGSPITTSGTLAIAYSGTALPIANGGTSATTANGAINALLPSQTGNSGKVLSTNGTDTSWAAVGGSGTVTSVDVSGGTTGLTTSGGPVTASGTITLAGTLAIANGGTGATSAGAALTSLGAYPDHLKLVGVDPTAGKFRKYYKDRAGQYFNQQ
jgi:hypothetical protein